MELKKLERMVKILLRNGSGALQKELIEERPPEMLESQVIGDFNKSLLETLQKNIRQFQLSDDDLKKLIASRSDLKNDPKIKHQLENVNASVLAAYPLLAAINEINSYPLLSEIDKLEP
jgi:uncharacterized membrane-anchored protein YjiN (DUF445 family)